MQEKSMILYKNEQICMDIFLNVSEIILISESITEFLYSLNQYMM